MVNFKPKDIIAILLILIFGGLKYSGMDGEVTPIVTLIIGYYFGHRRSGTDNGV